MVACCCVYGCSATAKNKEISFHRFPREAKLFKAWCVKIRTGKAISNYMRMCSKHFTDDDYMLPVALNGTAKVRRLRKTAVPSLNLPKASFTREKKPRRVLTYKNRPTVAIPSQESVSSSTSLSSIKLEADNAVSSDASAMVEKDVAEAIPSQESVSSPTSLSVIKLEEDNAVSSDASAMVEKDVAEAIPSQESVSSSTSLSLIKSEEDNTVPISSTISMQLCTNKSAAVEKDNTDSPMIRKCSHYFKVRKQLMALCIMTDAQVKYCTGFTRVQFDVLFEFVTTQAKFKPYPETVLNREDQLLMTLYKLRIGMEFRGMTCFFGVRDKLASKMFTHWVNLIYVAMREVDFWALKETQEDQYDIIIDCMEIPVASCSDPIKNQANYSTHKSRPTFKALVGISENGAGLFCSELYGGSTSDRQVVIQSGFLEKLKPGFHVLASKGLDISDLLETKQVLLNVPPFQRTQKQLTEGHVALTRRIEIRRRHVERLITAAKKYRIFQQTLPCHLWHLASEMFYITFFFANFKNSLR